AAPRIGLCRTPLWDTAQSETKHAVEDAAKRLSAAGATVRETTLPEEFSRLFEASRETINNYERSKSMAADWAANGERIRRSWATASGSAWRCGTTIISRRCGWQRTAAPRSSAHTKASTA